VHVLRDAGGEAEYAADGLLRVRELAGAGDERDGADAGGEGVDGAVASKESCGMRLPKSARAARSNTR
jgi:hypothetical protein